MVSKASASGNLGITMADMTEWGGNRGTIPATGVSWNEAARFVNWLNTRKGYPPAYKFRVQPGEAGYGPNSHIDLWVPGDAGFDPANPFRNSQAHYFLPSVHEWYEAAYYDPIAAVYYDFSTGRDDRPDEIDFSFDTEFDVVVGGQTRGPNDITNVGVLSPYGTAGQGGNVNEFEETRLWVGDFNPTSFRGARGCDWRDHNVAFWDMASWSRLQVEPDVKKFDVGFRVANAVTFVTDLNLDGGVDAAKYSRIGRGTASRLFQSRQQR